MESYEDMRTGVSAPLYTQEELDEAASAYAIEQCPNPDIRFFYEQAFKAGEQWVLQQMQKFEAEKTRPVISDAEIIEMAQHGSLLHAIQWYSRERGCCLAEARRQVYKLIGKNPEP